MNGKDICNLLKQYRKELSEKNGIDYEIKDCSHGDGCKGTCPFCEKETDELYALLREKENNGEIVDWTTSVKLPDESFVLDTDKFTDSGFEIRDVINDRISNGLCDDNISPDDNHSHMNELMGDIGYEHDYPETPYGELCEFFSSLKIS